MTKREFYKYVRQEIKPFDIKLYLGRGNQVNADGVRCSGYFCCETNVIAVADGPKRTDTQVLEVLAHEFNHFEQWRKNVVIWTKSMATGHTFNDIIKPNVPWSDELEQGLWDMQDLEIDCEKRTIKMVEDFQLPININTYARKANSYIYFYSFMKECRSWFPRGKAPYKIKAVYEAMPDYMLTGYKKIPEDIAKIYRKEYCR